MESVKVKPTKAVIAVAGYGTRRLPVAKAVEKCMLPLLNRPVVDYVVQDVIAAGVTDIYFVVSGGARQLRDYYSRNVELEDYLRAKGREDMLPLVVPPHNVRFHYIEQDEQNSRYGTAVPARLAEQYIDANESMYLIMGDQTFWRADGMSEAAQLYAAVLDDSSAVGGVMAVQVPEEDVERYGIVRMQDGYYHDIVEKPKRADAPSLLNNASFYLLPGGIMEYVQRLMAQKVPGEYQITDVLNEFAADGNHLAVYQTSATYLDCGTVESWVRSNSYLLAQA